MKIFRAVFVSAAVLALAVWAFGGYLLELAMPAINDYLKTFPESRHRSSEVESAHPRLACHNSHANWGEQARVTLSLDGQWDIAQGGLDESPPSRYGRQVPVPGLVTEARPGFARVGVASDEREAFWYRTFFVAPEDAAALAVLCLHKARFGARVWLNGQPLGSHHGTFTLSEYDLSGAIRYGRRNELVVRVGAEFTALPEFVPVGQDLEKYAWYPGLWDNVSLVFTGQGSIVRTKVEPDIDRGLAAVLTTVRNNGAAAAAFTLRQRVREWAGENWLAEAEALSVALRPGETVTMRQEVSLPGARMWSPERPFLYLVQSSLDHDGKPSDDRATRFGMRKVEWKSGGDKGFYLNNRRYYLRGTNIALHRFFEDRDRGLLPWNEHWVRALLSGHMKDFHWNSFRFHVGRAPNFWYDLADEIGLIVADEFLVFSPIRWGLPGTPHSRNWSLKELEKEFSGWVQENWNHPAIGWWDASNENHNPLLYEVVPLVRHHDETRSWESGSYRAPDRPSDPLEEHPYILNGTGFLNSKPRDYTLADLDEFSRLPPQSLGGIFSTWDGEGAREHPYINNEYGWLWLTRDGSDATVIARKAYDLLAPGVDLDPEQRREIYAYLVSELSGYWRAGRGYAGVQHFLYLGKCTDKDDIEEGADISQPSNTCDNFINIPALAMEPRWARWAPQAFAPVMVNIDRWAPAFYRPGRLDVPVTLVNDSYEDHPVTLELLVADGEGRVLDRSAALQFDLSALGDKRVAVEAEIPGGTPFVLYALLSGNFAPQPVVSRRKLGFEHPGVLTSLPADIGEKMRK
jgi:hypothetical protein